MSMRLHEAELYRGGGFWPIPLKTGTKDPAIKWRPVAQQTRPPTDAQLKSWFTNGQNVALLLGPKYHLLAVNVNVKNGHNGVATLRGYPMPTTPVVCTPNDGYALLFKPPEPERYPGKFGVHVYPDELPGCELRGTGGYQLMPSSTLATGTYRFADGWQLSPRLILQCADVPPWLIDLWTTLDRCGESGDLADLDTPEDRQPVSEDLMPGKPLKKTKILEDGRARVLLDTRSTPKCLTPKEVQALFGDFDANLAVAEFLHLPALGSSFLCRLHPEAHASMSLYRDRRTGAWKVHDWHGRGHYAHYGLADLYASTIIGREVRLKGTPTLTVWWLRALVAAKYLEPAEVPMRAMPLDARPALRTLYEGWLHLLACKWLYEQGKPSAFTVRFAMDWCGLSSHTVQECLYQLLRQGYLRRVGRHKGMWLYLPGRDQ